MWAKGGRRLARWSSLIMSPDLAALPISQWEEVLRSAETMFGPTQLFRHQVQGGGHALPHSDK